MRDIESIEAREIMNPDVVTVRSDMSIQEVASFLIDNEISGAPVENPEGALVGVVSLTDIVRSSSTQNVLARDQSNPDFFVRGWEDRLEISEISDFHIEDEGLAVGEIMTPSLYSVPENADISEVAETMLDAHLHRLLVTRGEKVVGIITTSDLLRLLV